MFCEKCGQANPDNAKFCEGCGSELQVAENTEAVEEMEVAEEVEVAEEIEATENNYYEYESAPEVPQNNLVKTILKIAVPVVAIGVVVGILAGVGLFKHPSEKALKKYMEAMADCDGKEIYELFVNPYELEQMLDSEYYDYDDEQDVIDAYIEDWEESKDYQEEELGENVKLKEFEVKKVTKYDKKDLKALNEYLSDYEGEGYEDAKLQDIRVIKVKVKFQGEDDDEKDTIEHVVYKTKNKWYVGGFAGLYDKDSIKSAIKSIDD